MAYTRRTREQIIAAGPKNAKVNSTLQNRGSKDKSGKIKQSKSILGNSLKTGTTPDTPIRALKSKSTATVKPKVSAKPKPTATKKPKKPLTASERAFLKNQKEKAKAVKRTGIYPNTAN